MTKVTLDSILTGYQSLQKINSNNTLITTAVENTLSRDGTAPNMMGADFDMNSHRILNLPTPQTPLEPARLVDITSGAVLTALSLINITVDTIAAMKAYTMSASLVGQLMYVRGFAAIGDGGEGLFRITATNPGSDNGGTQINSTTAGYYFIRQNVSAATPQMFGAKGDGTTNDHAALKLWINSGFFRLYLPTGTYKMNTVEILTIPGGVTIFGDGQAKSTITCASNIGTANFRINADNIQLRDFGLTFSVASYGFQIGNSVSSNRISFERVFFSGGGVVQASVWLHTCSDITVSHCRFEAGFYGVLQQQGYTCGTIYLDSNYIKNSDADFAAFNGVSNNASNIHITNNTFINSQDYPSNATENRFCDVTNVTNVWITGNFIQNAAGDAAIHLEDVSGFLIISNNIIRDCNASNGNNGMIYILNSQKYSIISNNWFIRTVGSAATARAFISTSSNTYSPRLVIANNSFYDGDHNMVACDLSFHQGQTIVNNNLSDGCIQFAEIHGAANILFEANRIMGGTKGVYDSTPDNAGYTAATDIQVIGNSFNCSGHSIRTGENTGGTNPPSKWSVKNNTIETGSGTLGQRMTDCFHQGNSYGSAVTNRTMAAVGGTSGTAAVRVVETNWNFLNGTGLV